MDETSLKELLKENDKLKQDCLKKQKHITHLENKIHRMREQIKKLEVLYHYRGQEGSVDLKTECYNLKKENAELKAVKRFAENNGINIFDINTVFRNCYDDNEKLTEDIRELRKKNIELRHLKLLANAFIVEKGLEIEFVKWCKE